QASPQQTLTLDKTLAPARRIPCGCRRGYSFRSRIARQVLELLTYRWNPLVAGRPAPFFLLELSARANNVRAPWDTFRQPTAIGTSEGAGMRGFTVRQLRTLAILTIVSGGAATGTAFADAIQAGVTIPGGQPTPVITENGSGYTPGSYGVGTIHL